MPQTTPRILEQAACLLHLRGLHTGEQFKFGTGDRSPLDVCAAIYIAAEKTTPAEFATDEVTSLEIIGASAPAMTAIRALSASLPTEPSFTEVYGWEVPDYIEHVCNWAATTPVFGDRPPTTSEVIGAILRAADAAATPGQVERSAA